MENITREMEKETQKIIKKSNLLKRIQGKEEKNIPM